MPSSSSAGARHTVGDGRGARGLERGGSRLQWVSALAVSLRT